MCRIHTEEGWSACDGTAVAPGIEYGDASFGVEDSADIQCFRTEYPVGNYRCLPAPVERAFHGVDVYNRRTEAMGAPATGWAKGCHRDMFTEL